MNNTSLKINFRSDIPAYAKEKFNDCILIKFFDSEEHRKYFLSGKLYMRSQTDFINSEMGAGRADVTEGAEVVVSHKNDETYPVTKFEMQDGNFCVNIVEYKEKPEGYRENQGFISYPLVNQKRNIFCMYTLWINTIANKHIDICKQEMQKFGAYGVVITNPIQFLNRIGAAFNQNASVLNAECGFVNYIREKNVMDMNPFSKPESYIMQNEFRICANTDNTNLLELPVEGGFEDISIPIRLDDFVESFEYREGIISFNVDKKVYLCPISTSLQRPPKTR